MGDLRSKLRARLSRRHSGVPGLPSSGSSGANDSRLSSNSADSEPTASSGSKRVKEGGDDKGPPSPQATLLPAGQLTDKLRQGETSQTGTGGSGNGSSKGDNQGKDHGGSDSASASPTSTANSSGPGAEGSASRTKNAAKGEPLNASTAIPASAPIIHSATSASTSTSTPTPTTPATGTGTGTDTNTDNDQEGQGPPQPQGKDRRAAANKNNNETQKTATSPKSNPPPPPSALRAPADESKPRAATGTVRRVRLSDPPVIADSPSTRPPAATAATNTPSSPNSADPLPDDTAQSPSSNPGGRPSAPPRRQSLLPGRQTTLIRTLLGGGPEQPDDLDPDAAELLLPISATMATRKLWVKRPGGSATLVTINEEDLVDDVRDLILRKYANSLGRQYDAPDVTLRIVPREGQRQEHVLGPEEPMARTLDAYYPGGQSVDEALLIDVPHRRTPRASPRHGPPHAQHLTSVGYEDYRPLEAGTDYFGPGAVAHIPVTIAGAVNGTTHHHSISVLNTGQVPQIPSPGAAAARRGYRERPERPRLGRQHTSSPTILNVVGAGGHTATIAVAAASNHGMQQHHMTSRPRSRTHSNASSDPVAAQQAAAAHMQPPLSTPPTQDHQNHQGMVPIQRTATPPPRSSSPRPAPPSGRPKKKKSSDPPALPAGMLNGGVPPINVLIVEDNIINLRLLEAFVKRLKVRWQTAMNGREAVSKWRTGGFHLVLMDIQLPVMSGLEATREIRRLERRNKIGAFSVVDGAGGCGEVDEEEEDGDGEIDEGDRLVQRELFKSPVIIVALTASSLQSDRHEALAAGCNDFLTKPVTYVWLERKVKEWGCMQALIDYDGWRLWKSYTTLPLEAGEAAPVVKKKGKKNKGVVNSSSSDGQ